MGRSFSEELESVAMAVYLLAWAFFLIMMALLIWMLVTMMISFIVWLIASTVTLVMELYLYSKYRRKADQKFKNLVRELGLDYEPDDVIHSLFGVGVEVPPGAGGGGSEFVGDILFGVEVSDV